MDSRSLCALEFPEILKMLSARAITELGRERARSLQPTTDPGTVRSLQSETQQARVALERKGLPRLHGVTDIRRHLEVARRGGTLGGDALLAVARVARAARGLKQYVAELPPECAGLKERCRRICSAKELEDEIDRCLSPDGELRDQASSELARLRRRRRNLAERLKEKLVEMTRDPATAKFLQEPLVTIRAGRFVLPVKAEAKSQFPGVVHDQSSSGMTLFVEPLVTVEMNNELRRLDVAAREEEERILRELSQLVGRYAEDLARALEILGWLDLVFAKAALARAQRACPVRILDEPVVQLVQVRNPLLGERAVPIDIEVGARFDCLVITGPNTGGKTVALKTLGLSVAMAQAGLQVPAAEAEMGVFQQLFADIGDEQSIQQNLSTFSSHMTNIVRFLRSAGRRTLVLLDEIGAGTDPVEGSALAMALLEYLLAAEAKVVCTTHYSALKIFAAQTQRVANGAVQFDPVTLAPTYQLVIGVPGRSNALDIGSRLGLPPAVLRRARQMLGSGQLDLEALLDQVGRYRSELRELVSRGRRLVNALEELVGAAERTCSQAQQEARRLREEARAYSRDLVLKVQREMKELMASARRAAARSSLRHIDRLSQQYREAVQEQLEQLAPRADPGIPRQPPASVAPGQTVWVVPLGQRGRVLEPPDTQGKVLIQVGNLKVTVPLRELRHADDAQQQGPGGRRSDAEPSAWHLAREKASAVSTELDLRGSTSDEARMRLDKYLDDAILAGLKQVKIIHGKGAGILRSVVSDFLRHYPGVLSHRLGQPEEGGRVSRW